LPSGVGLQTTCQAIKQATTTRSPKKEHRSYNKTGNDIFLAVAVACSKTETASHQKSLKAAIRLVLDRYGWQLQITDHTNCQHNQKNNTK